MRSAQYRHLHFVDPVSISWVCILPMSSVFPIFESADWYVLHEGRPVANTGRRRCRKSVSNQTRFYIRNNAVVQKPCVRPGSPTRGMHPVGLTRRISGCANQPPTATYRAPDVHATSDAPTPAWSFSHAAGRGATPKRLHAGPRLPVRCCASSLSARCIAAHVNTPQVAVRRVAFNGHPREAAVPRSAATCAR